MMHPCLNTWCLTIKTHRHSIIFFKHVKLKDYKTWILLFLLFVDMMLLNKSIYWKGQWYYLGGNAYCFEQSSITHGHRDNIILQRTRPCTQLYCSDENTYASYRQYTQQKDLKVFSNNSQVYITAFHFHTVIQQSLSI